MPPKLVTLKDLAKDEPEDEKQQKLFAGGLDGRGCVKTIPASSLPRCHTRACLPIHP